MQDAQVPTDPDDEATDPPRRSSLRLRDAEAVASVRRDMFGDGSLLDSLAGSPPAPAETEDPPPASLQGTGAESQGDLGQPSDQPPDPAAPAPLAPSPSADAAQPLDTIIDSFPAEPASGTPLDPGEEKADVSLAESATNVSTAPPTARLQMGISSLFDSLGSIGRRANDTRGPEE